MAERSGGQNSAASEWQCIHCKVAVSGMAAGFVISRCFICGKKQITCINPDCKEPFETEMEVCRKCHTSQQQPPDSSDSEINPGCKKPVNDNKADVCTSGGEQQPQPQPAPPPTTPPQQPKTQVVKDKASVENDNDNVISHDGSASQSSSSSASQPPPSVVESSVDKGVNVPLDKPSSGNSEDSTSENLDSMKRGMKDETKIDAEKINSGDTSHTPSSPDTVPPSSQGQAATQEYDQTQVRHANTQPEASTLPSSGNSTTKANSDDSSDHEYKTPPLSRDPHIGKNGKAGDRSVGPSPDLADVREKLNGNNRRKHSRDSEEAENESKPSKRRAIHEKEPKSLPTAETRVKGTSGEDQTKVKEGDEPKGSDHQVDKGGSHAKANDKATAYKKPDYKDAQEESLVKPDKTGKNRNKKKKKETGEEQGDEKAEDASGKSRPQTRSQTKSVIDVSGLNPTPEKMLEVTFHVLLPIEAWNWGKASRMCLRFGHTKLGDWKEDVGNFVMTRDLGDGLYEMECTVSIDSSLLKYETPVRYKYLVYSQRDEVEASPFEFLHGAPGGRGDIVNRKLIIDRNRYKEKGQYDQYDSMAYPETKSKNIFVRGWKFITGQSSKDDLYIPDHDSMQEKAMEVYLDCYKKSLTECDLSHHLDVVQIAEKIAYIFQHLFTMKIADSRDRFWIADKLPQAIKLWFQSICEDLQLIEIHSGEDNGRRMASALAVIFGLEKLIPRPLKRENMETQFLEILCLLLCPKPMCEKETCRDIEVVFSVVPKDSRSDVRDALNSFCMELSHRRHLNSPQWLYALPLLHHLRDPALRPFHKLQCEPNEITWTDKHLGLGGVRYQTQNKSFGIVKMYNQLEPLMKLDPFLLTTFVYVCPKSALNDLFALIPSCIATSWLIKDVRDNRFFLKSEVDGYAKLIDVITNRQQDEHCSRYQELTFTMRATCWLFFEFVKKVSERPEEQHRKAMKSITSLFLSTASRMRYFVDSNGDLKGAYDDELGRALKGFSVQLSNLLYKGYNESFGACNRTFLEYGSKSELQIWNTIMMAKFEKVDIHKEVFARWLDEVVEKTIKERLSAVPHNLRVKLFSILDSQKVVHDLITNVFMDSVMQSLEHMNMRDAASSMSLIWSSSQKEAVGKIFGRFLTRQYPKAEYISLEDLLHWDLWPNYILIYKSEGMIQRDSKNRSHSCLPERSSVLCGCAISTLDAVCDSIEDGSIVLKDLQSISEKLDQMEKLCSAVMTGSLEKKGEKYVRFKDIVHIRLMEYKAFNLRRNLLGNLCEGVAAHVTVTGLSNLQKELKKSYESAEIRSLCAYQGTSHIVNYCFLAAVPLDEIINKYDFMTRHHPNDLFRQMWQLTSKKAEKENPELTINDIVTKVWLPSFKECCRILDSLKSCSMKLREVNNRFRHYSDSNTIKVQLEKLYKGVELCHNKPAPTRPPWINSAVERMEQYWTLTRYAQAAETVLQLRQKLELTGDFSLMETIAKKVSSTMKDKTLEVIDQSLIEAGEFLGLIEEDQRRLNCLRDFANSLDVVEWIRTETKGLDDLHNFVSVALHTTAGESDFDSDRLSNLKKVGNGFGPLIFGLMKNKSFEAFRQGCLAVWENMKSAPDLPEQLLGCNSELAWYQSVKETQGSIEETTFGQMNNILAYGCYLVGSTRAQIFHSIDDIIHLTLTERDKRLTKKHYSLNELRDLESKLALIVGKNAANRTEVGVFTHTLHNVCRIAEVLLSLQQVGNVKYTGWRLQVPCELDHNVISVLQDKAKEMEHELILWKEEVVQKRGDFYGLNYFTTLQLLTLRKELGVIKSKPRSGPADVTPNVLSLLESVSTHVTAPCVFATVQTVLSDALRTGMASASVHSLQSQINPDPVAPSLSSPVVVGATSPGDASPSRPSIAQDILTSAVVHTSSGAEEMKVDAEPPTISEADLTQEQEGDMKDLISRYGFPRQLVLKAFEECKDKDNLAKYDIERWCNENVDRYDFEDEGEIDEQIDDEVHDDASDVSMSDSDDEIYTHQQPATPLSVSASASKASSYTMPEGHLRIREVEAQPQLPIDRNHPVVQQLCSAGYSEEESIDAVEKFENIDPAMEYLMSRGDEEGGLFPATPSRQDSSSIQRQTSGGARYVEQLDLKYGDSEPFIKCDRNAEKSYLSLDELGHVLTYLSESLQSIVPTTRTFNTKILKCGHPNLIVTTPDNVLRTALALFMEDGDLPLPTLEEVLICNSTTTAEEVTLLWQRAIGDPDYKRIFCLVHAERLTYQVSDKALRSLSDLTQGQRGYRLVIICSNEEEEKSHIISKLHSCKRPFAQTLDSDQCQHYLKTHFTGQVCSESSQMQPAMASIVDHESSCVRVVASQRSGMGKSLFIERMVENLQRNIRSTGQICVTVPLHGPRVTPDHVMDYLEKYMQQSSCTIFHFDIAPNILSEVDTILFSLLILCGLTDSQGRVWRCHPGQLYAVELTIPEGQVSVSQVGQTLALTELLPTVHCVSPRQSMDLMYDSGSNDPSIIVMDEEVFARPICQRVYQYLRRHMGSINLDDFSYTGNVEGKMKNCLEIFLHNCGIRDPTWSEIRHFIEFLDIQLKSCEESVFCDQMFVGDVMSGLKSFVVKFMIRMSRDFATSSLQGEVARENLEDMDIDGEGEDNLEQYQIASRRRWERNSHPYIFFNEDRVSITFVGFMVTKNGDLVDPIHRGVIEQSIMTSQLYTGLKHNRVNFDEDCRQWPKGTMIEKIATVMGIDFPYDPDETYVLTVDNLIKILAIQMRFRCGIPVVIMGETGCGKTRLIRYMCDLARQGEDRRNMLIMKVHGGTTEKDVEKFIKHAEKESEQNREKRMDTVVFFDEANTTDAIGLIKEIMCDRRIHGKPISHNLKFIAACNPYRKHSEDMIRRLENAGLGFYVRESADVKQKLGKIPLRQLVYRVLDLPPSMRPLVYDFGQLQQRTEDDYIKQIVHDHVTNHAGLSQESPHYMDAIAKVLAWSQAYMRDRKDECSFVSLRDVERAMIVFKYFYEKMNIFAPLIEEKQVEDEESDESYDEGSEEEDLPPRMHVRPRRRLQLTGKVTRALILSLSVCYHARLQVREDYETGVSRQFANPLSLPGGTERFRNEIRWCQEVLLDHMRLGDNIAKNAALRENVFMMAICIELRIPLFLVGKPGSSKSLAKAVIHASMRGKSSQSDLLRGFKEVDMFSYQCSQLSTPESVIDVFNTASRFQSKQDTTSYVAVVVLDEVGLAEDSPNLPLKALHPLLEDGTEGAGAEGKNDHILAREERVAFIGISNWALDPAKMNRGVMVTRGDPSEDELQFSAEGICSNKEEDPVKQRLKQYFKPLSEAYMTICRRQDREFFGLRDFYSLIKMLYWMCEKSGNPPTWPQLEHAIKRNFGGLESKDLDPVKVFMDQLPCRREPPDLSGIPEEDHHIINPDCTRFGLIQASLSSKERTWHGENRYLLFLTENYAALDILKHYLSGVDSSQTLSSADVRQETMEPFVLFGSSFPKDKEYTQVCRNINQIKICMETGRTVILLNLENLYESLYDVLNQYYIYNGGNRYVDLGLQTHRVRCRVHDDFKLIMIAEKDTVYQKFPTPLINRLEKHFVLTSSVLEDWQTNLLSEFERWISHFCDTRGKRFDTGDAFVGYQKDTPAAVVFQASNFLRRMREDDVRDVIESKLELLNKAGILDIISPDMLLDTIDTDEHWKRAVLPLSQFLLLQTAAPEAIVRLQRTNLDERKEIEAIYFKKLRHHSIEEFLTHQLEQCETKGGLLIQVTTHSHLLAHDELEQVRVAIGMRVESCSLHEFETELDFTSKIGPYFKRNEGQEYSLLLIIQCDSGHSTRDLIACARNRIYDVRSEKEGDTHVVFVIHLPHRATNSSFVGFQGDPWISVHIDDLRPTSDSTIMPYEAMGTTISELFMGCSTTTLEDARGLPKDGDEEGSDVEMDAMPSTRRSDTRQYVDEGESMEEDEAPPIEDIERMSQGSEAENEEEDMEEERVLPAGDPQLHQSVTVPPQCWRLHGCIQAAASKLEDNNKKRATQRVEILVNLIPRQIQLPLDQNSFHGILVEHVFSVLQQRDEVWESDKEWVLNEAMNARSLHNGGTFRNVLARKIDGVVVPVFSEIIACLDRNYNLDLINPRSENVPICRFWLEMFSRPKIMQFDYLEMTKPREKVPGVGGRRSAKDFKCQLPFSWIIKETVDAQWDNAKSSAGNNRRALHLQLCEGVCQTEVGEVLKSVPEEYCEEFYKYYLHDYVRNVHTSQQKKSEEEEEEYSLVEGALNEMVHDDEFSSIGGQDTLIRRAAALHVVYTQNKSQLMWFGQLVSQNPSVMQLLKDKQSPDTSEMMLHHFAVEIMLKKLEPPMERDKVAEHLLPWLNDLRLTHNAIDSILSLPPYNEVLERSRLGWQLIRAMQMFLEDILLKHSDVPVTYARRLQLFLKQHSDFLKAIALDKVKKHLNTMLKELKKKRPKTVNSIQRSCREFFMEVVSNLCFGGHKPPEPDLIKMLMDTVFTEKSESMEVETRDITPYQVDPDDVPVVRSFLLQLLLEHNSEQVKEHLNNYFTKSHQAFGRQMDRGLCLLCIQCFEDALYREFYEKCFVKRMEDAITILEDGHRSVREQGQYTDTVSLEYLEGVAKVRFALTIVAELLSQSGEARSQEGSELVMQLFHQTREVCTDTSINCLDTTGKKDTVGPVVYLLKLLVRQYGLSCLQKASQEHTWILPEVLRQTEEEEKIMDPFVIYNDVGYSVTRQSVSNAAYGKQLQAMVESCKNLSIEETVPLLLALYQKVTLSHASNQPSKRIFPDVLEDFDKFIIGSKVLSREMQWTARSLLANKQGGTFPMLSVTPHQPGQCRTLTALVVHTATVVFCRQKLDILFPFISMLTDPAKLANAYLPTMEEDHLLEARAALGGQFYACPRGHPYFVGECGRPVQELTCNTCGARIGGVNHHLRSDNVAARTNDTTQTGHDLGDPNGRTAVPAPERSLSPPAVCILRALMHSAFLWACCNNDQRIGDIVQLVKPHVPAPALAEFFWRHLDKDIQLLGRAVGKGYEEAAIIVHLVLKEILTNPPPGGASVGVTKSLGARNAREQWENVFNKHYIQAVLVSLETKVGLAMQTILADDDEEHDQLFFLAYERVDLMNQSSIQPHLWTYRSRITLEHLAQTLQERKMKERYPILHEFLQAEPVLRATQYLPDVVKLQQSLFDTFHHRLDKKDAKTQTVGGGEFLDKLKSENARNEYQERIGSLQKAWRLVGHMLKNHARLRVQEKHLIPAITLDTPLEYLIPTTTEAGACTTALVDFLVLAHNDFIEKCRATVCKDKMSTAFWRKHDVPITHIHQCHLVDYEHQILSIVLSHCNYSLTFGKGQSVKYDHKALQKHILDRFIHGKPRILSDIPHVVYRKDIYTTVTFAAVRKKVRKQELLASRVKQEILSELRTPDRLREALDVVEIVLGFLSSGGGKADKPLGEYIDRMLKMKRRPFSPKAREYCCLGHILSLWETVSVELARQLHRSGQEPFDSVKEAFLEPLEDEKKEALEKCLRLFDLDSLLGSLYEFIETYVKHSPNEELKWPVKDTLTEFWDRNELPHVQSFEDEFPDEITLSRAIAAWKCIVDYQYKTKENSQQ